MLLLDVSSSSLLRIPAVCCGPKADDARTATLASTPAADEPRVLGRELVPSPAMRNRGALVLAAKVLALRDRLEMCWVAACRPIAEVVYNKFTRNRPVRVLVGEAMRRDRSTVALTRIVPPLEAKSAVAMSLCRSLPRPACGRTPNPYECPESFPWRALFRSALHRNIVPGWYLQTASARRYA